MISSFGRIASLNKEITYKNRSKTRKVKPFLKKPSIRKDKYCNIYLEYNSQIKRFYVHRLVALHFLPNPHNYPYIDHIDTNPLNNNINNLKWCTPSMNSYNPITSVKNSLSHRSKPNVRSKPIVQIKDGKVINTFDYILLAEQEGHKSYGICHCLKDNKRTYHGYKWMYLSDYEALNKSKNESPDAEN